MAGCSGGALIKSVRIAPGKSGVNFSQQTYITREMHPDSFKGEQTYISNVPPWRQQIYNLHFTKKKIINCCLHL